MNRRNFSKQVLLSTFAGVAGLAIVAGVAFEVVHRSETPGTASAFATSNANKATAASDVNSSNAATNEAANSSTNSNKNSSVNSTTTNTSNNAKGSNQTGATNTATGSNVNTGKDTNVSNQSGRSSTNTNSTGQSPLNPGTLGEPANSPAGPTPPAWSPVGRVTISAASSTVELGAPDQLYLHGYDKQGKPFNLSGQKVTYRVSGPNDGTAVNSSGVFVAKSASIYQVDVLVDGVQSNLITIDVQPKTHPYKVTLTSSSNLVAGSSLQSVIMAHVVDVNGSDVQGATVTFSDNNTGVVSISGTRATTDVNGMASVQATSVGAGGGTATITVKVATSGETASTTVVVNAKPAKIDLVGNVQLIEPGIGYFLVKVEDAAGNGIPGIATKPTISGGAILGANQYAFTSDTSGVVKILVNLMNNSPIQATIDVMGTNISWSGTVPR